jgi:hypothetical protein
MDKKQEQETKRKRERGKSITKYIHNSNADVLV